MHSPLIYLLFIRDLVSIHTGLGRVGKRIPHTETRGQFYLLLLLLAARLSPIELRGGFRLPQFITSRHLHLPR
jgi:hypothetical protein